MAFAVTTLDFSNAKALFQEGLTAVSKGEETFDFAELKQVDSASVSVMLAWQRAALRSGRKIRFLNVPASLVSLADLYGVTELLDLVVRA
ncbi:MAG: STAS domain-containing protein [Oxalobacter sp.]|nr:STAS domain-containing protein [Oxalobacter sp.]MBR6000843.1 STAS domain-containing protein [Oxalobacter sp.]